LLSFIHVNVINCQNFNSPHIYCIFVLKFPFLKEKFTNWSHGIQTWFKICEMTWFNIPSTFIKIKNHLNFFLEYICVFECISTLHLFPQICSNLPLYKMKWNSSFFHILPIYVIFQHNMQKYCEIFQKFEMGYIQACTPLESSIMWHPKGDHHNVFSLITKTFIIESCIRCV
jgi:hypothetical protein